MTAMGQANALAVMAVGDKGCFLNAPDMYMEKLIVGPGAKGAIDLNLPLEENLHNIARALNKPLGELDRHRAGETAPRRGHCPAAAAGRARVRYSRWRRRGLYSHLHAG